MHVNTNTLLICNFSCHENKIVNENFHPIRYQISLRILPFPYRLKSPLKKSIGAFNLNSRWCLFQTNVYVKTRIKTYSWHFPVATKAHHTQTLNQSMSTYTVAKRHNRETMNRNSRVRSRMLYGNQFMALLPWWLNIMCSTNQQEKQHNIKIKRFRFNKW